MRVDKNGPIPAHRAQYLNCWLWTGKLVHGGYGRIYRHFPDAVRTHRLAWELATGETLTEDDIIGHICDVRHCVRTDEVGTYQVGDRLLPRRGHLFKGTHEDNRLDMMEKGRGRFVLEQYVKRGTDHPSARLSEDDVRSIRRLYAQGGISQEAIGQRFGIDQTVVSKIVLRKTWRHVE